MWCCTEKLQRFLIKNNSTTAEILLLSGFLSRFKSPMPHVSVETYLIMKYQPPSIRTDTVLLTMMGIFLLAGFEDVFFAGRLHSQIQSMQPAHSLLGCELWYGSVCNGHGSQSCLKSHACWKKW